MSEVEQTSDHWTARLPKKRMAAGALFFDKDGRVLLVEPTYTPGWDYPGGVVEANETPYVAACREIEEELGLSTKLGALLAADWEPARDEIPLEGFGVVFDGGVLSDDEIARIRLPAEELHRFGFFTPAEAAELLPAHLWRRVSAAMRARDDATAVYLDDGYPVR
ncbi:NUDIX hydrolase [Actinopolymorpha sp. B17G11]|uniref:NUDIX hydrolase n=1 Tax=unclassified Actinopolymorpha TaxID=2627063 RepID=UPI0032D955FB